MLLFLPSFSFFTDPDLSPAHVNKLPTDAAADLLNLILTFRDRNGAVLELPPRVKDLIEQVRKGGFVTNNGQQPEKSTKFVDSLHHFFGEVRNRC